MSIPGDWLTFVEKQDGSASQPSLDPAATDLVCDLSQIGLIRLAGADTATFLQGQLSNDIRKLDANHSQLTSYSNPKGRMLAIARAFVRDGDYWLALPEQLVVTVQRRLTMFVLRSQVTITDGGGELARFGLAGPNAPELLDTCGLKAPGSIDGVTSDAGITAIRVAGTIPRFEIYAPPAKARELWTGLRGPARISHPQVWALLNVRAGIPSVYPQTSEAFVAQMTNLELIDGVSFSKGCYTGQEVIARMHYLGKPKRRMYGFAVAGTTVPPAGTELVSTSVDPPLSVGTVVEAANEADDRQLGLAVVQKQHLDDQIHLGSATGPRIEIRELPYAIDAGE